MKLAIRLAVLVPTTGVKMGSNLNGLVTVSRGRSTIRHQTSSILEHGGSGPFFEVDMYRLIDFKTDMDATTLNGLIIENNAFLQDDFVITWPSWRFPFDEMGFEPHSEISSIRWTCQRFFAKGSFWLYKYTKGQMLYALIEIQLKENSNRTFMEGLNIIFETDYLLRQAIGKKIETSLSGTGVELQHDPERYNTTPIGGKSQIGETSVKQKYTTEEAMGYKLSLLVNYYVNHLALNNFS